MGFVAGSLTGDDTEAGPSVPVVTEGSRYRRWLDVGPSWYMGKAIDSSSLSSSLQPMSSDRLLEDLDVDDDDCEKSTVDEGVEDEYRLGGCSALYA